MKTNNDNNISSPGIPEHDSSKAMDSKKEVERSNDNKIDQDFPGYPHAPAREDIMGQSNEDKSKNRDVEDLPKSNNMTGVSQRFESGNNIDKSEES